MCKAARRARAQRAGAEDALLPGPGGVVLETPVANVFAVIGSVVVTPPAPRRCLPGVGRAWLLEELPHIGLAVAQRDLGCEELLGADEVWISNAVVGLRRVGVVGRRRWRRWPVFSRVAAAGIPAPGWRSPVRP